MGDEEQQDFSKLDIEDKLKHKNWKARQLGYEELYKVFAQACDDNEFKKYASSVKNFVQDPHAAAQEKGLEAALLFVSDASSALAGKVCGDVVAGIVNKCFTARPKAREKGIEIILLYFEIDKQEATLEELIKGLTNKSPKVVSGSISLIREALRLYGPKAVALKTVIPTIQPLLEDRDKSVRDEAKALLVEIYRWIGDAIKPLLKSLKPVQLTELDTEFEKHKGTKAVPEKLQRSEQAKQAKQSAAQEVATTSADAEEVEEDAPEVVTLDLFPVELFKKPEESQAFFAKLESKKWADRKEALEKDVMEKIPDDGVKLVDGDYYGEMIAKLKTIIAKDTNVNVVAHAGTCLAKVAKGLQQRFTPYAHSCVSVILEKFKEKKQQVVVAMREALDACFLSLTLETITEDLIEALGHKTPTVKAEAASFLTRCFSKFNPEDLPKKQLKTFVEALLKNCIDPDETVRNAAFEALGTAMKVVGEKPMLPFITELEETKSKKIREYCDKAVIVAPKRKKPAAAPAKPSQPAAGAPKAEGAKPAGKKPVTRPAAKPASVKKTSVEDLSDIVPKEAPVEPASGAAKPKTGVAKKVVPPAKSKSAPKEEELGPIITVVLKGKTQRANDEKLLKVLKWTFQMPTKEFVQQLRDQMEPCFSPSMVTWMFSDDFKNHVKAIDALQNSIGNKETGNKEATISVLDLILKWFTLRFFDTNPTVLAKTLDYLQLLFRRVVEKDTENEKDFTLTEIEVSSFVPFLLLKVGDPKDVTRNQVRAVVKQLCCVTPFSKIYSFLSDGVKSKNARQRAECIDLATWTMETYGIDACFPSPQVALKLIAQQIGDRDAGVRNAALNNLLYAYQLVNEKLFKFVAPLSEKDRSMLEERIKRAPKKATAVVPPPPTEKPSVKGKAAAIPATQSVEEPEIPADDGPSTSQAVPMQAERSLKNGKAEAAPMPAAVEKDDPLTRPATVTLRRAAPQLIPVSQQDLDFALGSVKIPQLQKSSPHSSGGGTLSALINGILSTDPKISLKSLEAADDLISKQRSSEAIRDSLPQLYRALIHVLRQLHNSFMSNYPTNHLYIGACYTRVLNIIRILFENPGCANQANAEVLTDLMRSLILVLLDKRMAKMTGGEGIVRNVNIITLRIVDTAERTEIICATVRLLRDSVGSSNSADLDLVIKCVWRCVRKMPDTIVQLNVDPVLFEIHEFLKQFPAAYWQQEAVDDTPFRTVKTVVYTLTKVFGSEILNHLSLIDDSKNSELVTFLKRVLKSVDREGGGDRVQNMDNGRLHDEDFNGNMELHEETLSNIVKKVGSSDDKTVQQGLRELYDYKEAHAINLESFLERTSPEFQKFVNDGLRMIEFEQKALGLPTTGLSEKGQGIINRLRGVISSPFITAQDIESVKQMAADVKLQIRDRCFETAQQRVDDAIRAADVRVQNANAENSGSPRLPSILSPSRALKPSDDNSPAVKPDNLDAVKARVKAYLQNKGN